MVDGSFRMRHYNTFIPGIGWHVAVLPVAKCLADSASLRRFFFKVNTFCLVLLSEFCRLGHPVSERDPSMHVLDTCCPLMAVGPCEPWDSTGFVHSVQGICLAQNFAQCFYSLGQISGEKVW